MSDRKEPAKTSRRTQLARKRRFPSLEFRTAGWLLECWADRCDDLDVANIRRVELVNKLEDLRQAITPKQDDQGERKKQEKVPREVIYYEYLACKPAVTGLRRRLVTEDRNQQLVLLKAVGLNYYSIKRPNLVSLARPLVLTREQHALESLRLRLTKKDPPIHSLCKEFVGSLFNVSASRVGENCRDVEKDESRMKPDPRPVQSYLVAMFMLAARLGSDNGNLKRLDKILAALLNSRYDAKAIYHLSRWVSTMSDDANKPAWKYRPQLDWEEIEIGIRLATETCEKPQAR